MKTMNMLMMCVAALVASCGGAGATGEGAGETAGAPAYERVATFNADTAYSYVAAQTAFGPRVPGTAAHAACGDYLAGALRAAGVDTVTVQYGPVTDYTGRQLRAMQIMGRINPEAAKRVLLLAHWDTRPWADHDPAAERRSEPVEGANDGASGVGVLLEVARQLSQQRPVIGVDILFTDVEDSGCGDDSVDDPNTWALGTQWWVEHMPYGVSGRPVYAILLDMVGGRNAVFHKEGYSVRHASAVVNKVWQQARRSGLGDRFPMATGGYIIDDHIYLLQAGIPAINIIESMNAQTGSFNPTWHTTDDTLANIDATTLGVVGQLVLDVIYGEK